MDMNSKEYRLNYSVRCGLRRALRDLNVLYGLYKDEEAGKIHDKIVPLFNKLREKIKK